MKRIVIMRTMSLLVMTLVTQTSAVQRQFFIREPDNQTAIEGEQVSHDHHHQGNVIHCGVEMRQGERVWWWV